MTPSSSQPPDRAVSETESRDSELIVIEGPGDKTRRPRRPNIPLEPPSRPAAPPRPEDHPPS